MRRPRPNLPSLQELSHSCPQCGQQITPPEMMRLDSETMRCPHCGDPYTEWVKIPKPWTV